MVEKSFKLCPCSDHQIMIPIIRVSLDSQKDIGQTNLNSWRSPVHHVILLPPSSKTVTVRVKQVKVSTYLTPMALISPALRG